MGGCVKAELWCVLGGERAGARTASQVRERDGAPGGSRMQGVRHQGGPSSGSARLAGTALLEQHVMCRGGGGPRARRRGGARRAKRASAGEVDRLRGHLIRRASGTDWWLGMWLGM
jgi:hypothetical protein